MEEKRGFCSFILGILSDLAIYINKFFNCNIVIANNSGFSNLLQGSLRYVQLRWRKSTKKYREHLLPYDAFASRCLSLELQMPVDKFKIKSFSKEVEALYYLPRPKRNRQSKQTKVYIYLNMKRR